MYDNKLPIEHVKKNPLKVLRYALDQLEEDYQWDFANWIRAALCDPDFGDLQPNNSGLLFLLYIEVNKLLGHVRPLAAENTLKFKSWDDFPKNLKELPLKSIQQYFEMIKISDTRFLLWRSFEAALTVEGYIFHDRMDRSALILLFQNILLILEASHEILVATHNSNNITR